MITKLEKGTKVGVLGSGTMGIGIAQVAATVGHEVVLFDVNAEALENAKSKLQKILDRLVEKEKINQETADVIFGKITWAGSMNDFAGCGIVIEAIIENSDIKQSVFKELDSICGPDAILATNTSSLSVASIAAACEKAERVIGIHFFNPAPLMQMVEIVPAVQTSSETLNNSKELIGSWGKTTVIAKDTPGFIVNRVARPFYGEALRIYEEGFADFATIDYAMKELGSFRMGPFELMDFIGNDLTYTITCTVFEAFYCDPRYKPIFTHKSLSEAGWWGRKSGKGYYDYVESANNPEPKTEDKELLEHILWRILVMLINEAADALYLNIASRDDIDMAMTKGVNYPKGLLQWADEKGIQHCVETMDRLHDEYHEDRYRCSPLLRRMAKETQTFY